MLFFLVAFLFRCPCYSARTATPTNLSHSVLFSKPSLAFQLAPALSHFLAISRYTSEPVRWVSGCLCHRHRLKRQGNNREYCTLKAKEEKQDTPDTLTER